MLTKKVLISLFLSTILQAFPPLYGEVVNVRVNWNSISCNQNCANLIQKNFESLKQVESVSINAKSGTADLKWNPKFPFSYKAIDTKMRMVGASLIGVYIRVKGYAMSKGNKVVLSSIGDQTEFTLISPIPTGPGEYIGFPDASKLSLSPELQKKILDASTEKKVIVVEGPIYRGYVAPPLYLMIQRLQIEKNKQQ